MNDADNKHQNIQSAPPATIYASVPNADTTIFGVPIDGEFLITHIEINGPAGAVLTLRDVFTTHAGAALNPIVGVFTIPAAGYLEVKPRDKVVLNSLHGILSVAGPASVIIHGRKVRGFFVY